MNIASIFTWKKTFVRKKRSLYAIPRILKTYLLSRQHKWMFLYISKEASLLFFQNSLIVVIIHLIDTHLLNYFLLPGYSLFESD